MNTISAFRFNVQKEQRKQKVAEKTKNHFWIIVNGAIHSSPPKPTLTSTAQISNQISSKYETLLPTPLSFVPL